MANGALQAEGKSNVKKHEADTENKITQEAQPASGCTSLTASQTRIDSCYKLTRTAPIVFRVDINARTTKGVGARQCHGPHRDGLTQGTVQALLQGLQGLAHARRHFSVVGSSLCQQERGRLTEMLLFLGNGGVVLRRGHAIPVDDAVVVYAHVPRRPIDAMSRASRRT